MTTKINLLFVIAIILVSCKCPMKSVDKWQTLTKGTDINKQTNALAQLIASADGDIKELNNVIESGNASGKLDLKWELSKESKKNIYKNTAWDPDVWHDIQLSQRAYCSLYNEIKQGLYNNPSSYSSALKQLERTREYLLTAKKKLEEPTSK